MTTWKQFLAVLKNTASGTNFWVALIMGVFGFAKGLSETDVRDSVTLLYQLVGGGFLIREKVKAGGIDVKKWLLNGNTFNYIFAVVATFLPSIPPDIFNSLADVVGAALTKNYNLLFSGIVAIGISVFYFIRNLLSQEKEDDPAIA